MFARTMKLSAALCGVLAAVSIALYAGIGGDAALTLSITFCACFYHLAMRLAVGTLVDLMLHNRVDYNRPWFRQKPFETKLYRILKVKNWKGRMPTYAPELFSVEVHSLDEIAMAMCQAELVHEISAVLSFLPLAAVPRFGGFAAFLITSVLSACVDMTFVTMQRYNRPRIVKLAKVRSAAERNNRAGVGREL